MRQLLRHRYKLVCWRTSLKNQLHAMAMGQGLCRKKKLWTAVGRKELQGPSLGPWASRRRQQLLEMLDQLEPVMEELDRAVIEEAEKRPAAMRLMTQPGVGPVTALAFVLTIGPVERFPKSRKLVSYLGLNPSENSSGGKQRLSGISKQGNSSAMIFAAGRSSQDGLDIRSGIAAGLSGDCATAAAVGWRR